MDLGLLGKNALVTGGSKGIGLACAELLARKVAASASPRACKPISMRRENGSMDASHTRPTSPLPRKQHA